MALILPRRKAGLDISQLFSVDLYTGNGSTQTITNGIDLSGEGGAVWVKGRSTAYNHRITDTDRGATKVLYPNDTLAEGTESGITAFNSDGFSLGSAAGQNQNTDTHVAWTFRKSPSFFDVVTYTGDGTAGRTISHNLGVAPGMIVVKRTNAGGTNWIVYHRSLNSGDILLLNLTDAAATAGPFLFGNGSVVVGPSNTEFTIGTASSLNASGDNYVAYCFSHDTTDNGVIQCGSYTGNGSTTGPTVTLGWEPQWVMIKRADSTGDWFIFDDQRGSFGAGSDVYLRPNLSNAEAGSGASFFTLSATGFQLTTTNSTFNASGGDYIYLAIRKEGV